MSSNPTAEATSSNTPKTNQAKKLATAFADAVQLIIESHEELELQLARQTRLTEQQGVKHPENNIDAARYLADLEAYRDQVAKKDREIKELQIELEKRRYECSMLVRDRNLLQATLDGLTDAGNPASTHSENNIDIKYLQEKAGLFDRDNLDLRIKYVMTLREVVGRRCPKNKVGTPVVSDLDVLLGVSDQEHLEVLRKLKLL